MFQVLYSKALNIAQYMPDGLGYSVMDKEQFLNNKKMLGENATNNHLIKCIKLGNNT